MRTIFGDTSFFVALLNPKDVLNDAAFRLRRELSPFHLVTTQMVLTELLNDFSARGEFSRRTAVRFVDQLLQSSLRESPAVSVVPQTPEQFDVALAM